MHSREHPGPRVEQRGSAWEPLGGATRGGDRGSAPQMKETYEVLE